MIYKIARYTILMQALAQWIGVGWDEDFAAISWGNGVLAAIQYSHHHHHHLHHHQTKTIFLSSPLSLLSSSSSSPFLSPITPNPSPQVVEKARMELVEVEASLDMAWTAVDDFLVEELLVEPEQEEEEEEEVEAFGTEEANVSPASSSALSSHPPPPIDFPAEDVAELEWVSRFVDDSFLEFSSEEDHNPHRHGRPPHQTPLPFLSSKRPPPSIDHLLVPVKARTKRSRTAGHFWLTSPSPSSSSSSTSAHFPEVRKHKKRGRKPKPRPLPAPPPAATGERSCTHCGVQKTPQWRAGPAGPKTLCNACGVRYKSGRLLPEYRPASSPTFSVQLHSNSHRKVIEMRSKKARAEPDRTGVELLP